MSIQKRMKYLAKSAVLNSHGIFLRLAMVAQRRIKNPGEIDECIQTFHDESHSLRKHETRALHRAILRDMRKHLITPDEYFLYDFANLDDSEKHEFVGDMERTVLCARLYNSNDGGLVFMDKGKTYERFAPYFKRDVVTISSEGDSDEFFRFVSSHKKFMVKPASASRGNGIYLETVKDDSEAEEAFERILQQGACVIEELIGQAAAMARFHSKSVNTVRYATYVEKGKTSTIACFVKLGRGDSIVDNGGAGGLLASIDDETGVIVSPGRDEFGESYETHPDTGVPIVGAQIPDWTGLKDLVAELVKVLPSQKYVGWDLAYADDGWVLVEGNSGGQFVGPQISMRKGIRPVIAATFGEL